MYSTSSSREGQDASTLLKTPTSEAKIHESLRVLRFGQLLKGCEISSMYELSESDVRLGWDKEFGEMLRNLSRFVRSKKPKWCLSVRTLVCFTQVTERIQVLSIPFTPWYEKWSITISIVQV